MTMVKYCKLIIKFSRIFLKSVFFLYFSESRIEFVIPESNTKDTDLADDDQQPISDHENENEWEGKKQMSNCSKLGKRAGSSSQLYFISY